MTDYEIISTIIAIIALLFTSSGFIIAFLTFLEKRNNSKK